MHVGHSSASGSATRSSTATRCAATLGLDRRRPGGARGRRLLGRRRRGRHRRGDREERRVPPDHRLRPRRQPAGRARGTRLRHGHRLDRRDARADEGGRRAGRERGRAHVHGGVRRRAARDHVPAHRGARQGQRGDDGARGRQLLRARRSRAAHAAVGGHPPGPRARPPRDTRAATCSSPTRPTTSSSLAATNAPRSTARDAWCPCARPRPARRLGSPLPPCWCSNAGSPSAPRRCRRSASAWRSRPRRAPHCVPRRAPRPRSSSTIRCCSTG